MGIETRYSLQDVVADGGYYESGSSCLGCGDWFNAIGLFGYGAIVVSQSDNLIRFILQKKMADTHPLITIFGVVIGLPIFGFMGVIFGPLLLSLFFLFVDMFKKEYLDLRNNLPSR